jgi:16S rRNA (adenine1518-N6/adenine1519-N6)-dimethyltransferase
MDRVRAKKHLGQHFLTDLDIAKRIAESLQLNTYTKLLEIGPGMGVLTQFLLQNPQKEVYVIDIDSESIGYLKEHFPQLNQKVIEGDFLKLDLAKLFNNTEFGLIGNYPYNISSQIVFKMLDYKHLIPEMSGMFQKEVAERICSGPGSKEYGIISVLTQAYYNAEYLFTVNENVFNPPPKVKSGVLRLTRKKETILPCNEILFKQVVKTSFNQRRKMLRNSLRGLGFTAEQLSEEIYTKRPEQLSLQQFYSITNQLEANRKEN